MQTESTSTLTGVIIGAAVVAFGSLLTFLGQLFSQWLTSRREDKKWLREEKSAEGKRVREENRERDRETRDIFQNTLRCLAGLISIGESNIDVSPPQKLARIEEAHKWLNLLSLRYHITESPKVKKFNDCLTIFVNNPINSAEDLRDAVIALAAIDAALFPNADIKALEEVKKVKPEGITFRMELDDDFRRQQITKAVDVPKTYNFERQLSELTESQRELLVNIYYPDHKGIPSTLQLPMPSPRPNPNRPYTWGLHWKGKVNPATSTPAEILTMWERDYKEAFEKVNAANTSDTSK